MLGFHFIVWPGIPLNSTYCGFATHHLLINDPNYNMQQPPLTQIQHLCIFLRVGMITLFIAFNPSKTKGEGEKEVFHRESITHTHTVYLQEYSKRPIYCKEDYGYLQIPCAGSQLIYSFCYSLLLHRKSTRCLSSGMQCSGQHLLLDLWQPVRVFWVEFIVRTFLFHQKLLPTIHISLLMGKQDAVPPTAIPHVGKSDIESNCRVWLISEIEMHQTASVTRWQESKISSNLPPHLLQSEPAQTCLLSG